MAKNIIIKPIITEKAEALSENMGQYSFVVDKRSNKVQIRKAVEKQFNVSVDSVNTLNMPKKSKSRNTK